MARPCVIKGLPVYGSASGTIWNDVLSLAMCRQREHQDVAVQHFFLLRFTLRDVWELPQDRCGEGRQRAAIEHRRFRPCPAQRVSEALG